MAVFTFSPQTGNTLFGEMGPKNKGYQFKLEFHIQNNSIMQNSMAVFTFSVLDRK